MLTVIVVLVVMLVMRLDVPERVVQVVASRQERLVPIYYVETEEKKVAISFDASWGDSTILHILSDSSLPPEKLRPSGQR